MANKKRKGKKGKRKKSKANILLAVDKTFFELQIVDLNRKLARFRSFSAELEQKVDQLEQQLSKSDSDHIDVINCLKRNLTDKTNECLNLSERVMAFEASKELDEQNREKERKELQVEFENMREQLISQIKLMNMKLNTLEDFRIQRVELMAKFELQENQREEQDLRHKQNLYEIERKYILSKDAIKHEMEQQLFTLAKDFESANELRIAATTQRVVRENIVINNELNKLINASEYSQKENEALRARNKELTLFNELLETERNKAIKDFSIQKEIINQIVDEVALQKQITARHKCEIERGNIAINKLNDMKINENILKDQVRIAERNMHNLRCIEYIHRKEKNLFKEHIWQLKEIIYEAMYVIQNVLSLGQITNGVEAYNLLLDLINTIRNLIEEIARNAPEESALSTSGGKADMGFLKIAMYLHQNTQVGPSLCDIMLAHQEGIGEGQEQKKKIKNYEKALRKELKDKQRLDEMILKENLYKAKLKILDESLNVTRDNEKKLQIELSAELKARQIFETIIGEARLLIESTLREYPSLLEKVQLPNNENLLNNILNILSYSINDVVLTTDIDTGSTIDNEETNSELKMSDIVSEMETIISSDETIELKKVSIMPVNTISHETLVSECTSKSTSEETRTILQEESRFEKEDSNMNLKI